MAQALLNDANLTADAVRGCADRLTGSLQRYLPQFHRVEQRYNATLVIRGEGQGAERVAEEIVQDLPLPHPFRNSRRLDTGKPVTGR